MAKRERENHAAKCLLNVRVVVANPNPNEVVKVNMKLKHEHENMFTEKECPAIYGCASYEW